MGKDDDDTGVFAHAVLRGTSVRHRPPGRRQMTREYLLTPSPLPREGATAPCLLFHKKGHKRATLHLAGGKFWRSRGFPT